jgi:hypothetical protein
MIKGKENSASTIEILFGLIYNEFPKKSEPTPTNKSENTKPKNILNIANINKGMITNKLASCVLEYTNLDPLGTVKKTKLINLKL